MGENRFTIKVGIHNLSPEMGVFAVWLKYDFRKANL